ncbi:MAG: YifB family Mg chelatase-like AAA ATPase [Tissierellia bacterium]|nr:YifB family Mg chelatase-like AAA ATPase [Tissierellia bacterium]
MYSKLNTCILQGLSGNIIEVETDLSRGLPVFNIVGLPDASIKESKERVRTAIKNSGFEFPLSRITVNLAPAHLKKEGSQLDLAIALGIMQAMGVVGDFNYRDIAFIGELSLDGRLNPIEGVLPMVISMRESNIKRCILPFDNKDEACIVKDVEIIPIQNLEQAIDYLNKKISIPPFRNKNPLPLQDYGEFDVDFSDIKGQRSLKRALEVAAAGFHNLLVIGPPGAGKTMAARRLPTILPELSFNEAIEVIKIYSIAGLLNRDVLIEGRPFRAPHHTASSVALVGGGRIPKPGEISLAHNGVLFLDEIPEFKKNVLEVLRQPLEDGTVTISRMNATLVYPAKFMMIASMNPCPCGYLGDPFHECSCSQNSIDRYLGKLSNPLLDRIDIHIEILPVKYEELSDNDNEETSAAIRERVNNARQIQLERYRGEKIYNNSQINSKSIQKYCRLDNGARRIIETAFNRYKFSARTYNKILKVSRTIADLDDADIILEKHILEAIRYRGLDNKYWG